MTIHYYIKEAYLVHCVLVGKGVFFTASNEGIFIDGVQYGVNC